MAQAAPSILPCWAAALTFGVLSLPIISKYTAGLYMPWVLQVLLRRRIRRHYSIKVQSARASLQSCSYTLLQLPCMFMIRNSWLQIVTRPVCTHVAASFVLTCYVTVLVPASFCLAITAKDADIGKLHSLLALSSVMPSGVMSFNTSQHI